MPIAARPHLVLPALLLVTMPAACASWFADEAPPVALERAARLLQEGVDMVASRYELAGERLAAAADATAEKRLSVRFRQNAIGAAWDTLRYRDPRVGLIDLWALCEQYEAYLTTGAGSAIFGDHQRIVAGAAATCASRLAELADRAFDDRQFDRAREVVRQYSERFPVDDYFIRYGLSPTRIDLDEGAPPFGFLREFSLSRINPFTPLSEEIGSGAETIAHVAGRFAETAEALPHELGWQLELFLYDLEDSSSVRQVNATLRSASATLDEAVEVVRDLPGSVGSEVESVLAGASPALEQAQTVGDSWGRTARSIDAMAGQVEATLTTFRGVLAQLGVTAAQQAAERRGEAGGDGEGGDDGDGGSQGGEDGDGFDVLEWNRTARSIEDAAASLERTLAQFHEVLASRELERGIQRVPAAAGATTRAVVWPIVLGALVLVAVGCAASVLWRWFRRRRESARSLR